MNNNLLSTLTFLTHGHRGDTHTKNIDTALLSLVCNDPTINDNKLNIPTFEKLNIDIIRSLQTYDIKDEQKKDEDKKEFHHVDVDVNKYIESIGAKHYITNLIGLNVDKVCKELYNPIKVRVEQISKVLDIDFDM